MKKLILFFLCLPVLVKAQQLKTRSDGTFTQVDTYVIGSKTLGIPSGSAQTLNGGLARDGQLFYNTTTKTLYVYDTATSSWKPSTPIADLSPYKLKSDSTGSTGYQTIGNLYYRGDLRYLKLTGGTIANLSVTGNISAYSQLNSYDAPMAFFGSNPVTSTSIYITHDGIKIGTDGDLTNDYTQYGDRVINIDNGSTLFFQYIQEANGTLALLSDIVARVPNGGSTGQVLAKINGTDGNTQWVTPAIAPNANFQFLTVSSYANMNAALSSSTSLTQIFFVTNDEEFGNGNPAIYMRSHDGVDFNFTRFSQQKVNP